MSWTFDGKSCAAAGIDSVTILVDPDSNGSGGINAGTAKLSVDNGANVLVAGTSIFRAEDYAKAIDGLRGK